MNNNRSLAFVFPGQGSQKQGMLNEFSRSQPLIKSTIDEGSEALGLDLWSLMQEGSQEQLSLTENAQPLILSASIALWRLWVSKQGTFPGYLAGHSLGEWSALVASGVLEYGHALCLVRLRGQFMQQAVPVGIGAMAAIIGMDDSAVEAACAKVCDASEEGDERVVMPVNYNSPGQIVIAGHKLAVEAAILNCKEAGAKKAMLLPVSAPFHTPLMKPAADQLAEHIANTTFKLPSIPVIQNVGVVAQSDPEQIKSLLIEQIYSPVPWVSTVQKMASLGVDTLCECGPGKVLSGLNRRIDKSMSMHALESENSFLGALESLSTLQNQNS